MPILPNFNTTTATTVRHAIPIKPSMHENPAANRKHVIMQPSWTLQTRIWTGLREVVQVPRMLSVPADPSSAVNNNLDARVGTHQISDPITLVRPYSEL